MEPEGQTAQAEPPRDGWYCPEAQFAQLTSGDPYRPTSQDEQATAPVSIIPAGHEVHAEDPAAGWKVSVAHEMQLEAAAAGLKDPAGQRRQLELPSAAL